MLTLLSNQITEAFGIAFFDPEAFLELVIRFVFNFVATFLIVRYVYYPKTHRRDFLFTFILIGIVVFLMCFLLESVKLQLGFALGLFAVFGIIRYRTMAIPIKEMTYLFVVIGLSVVNALANKKVSYAELVFTNLIVLGVTYFIEKVKNIDNFRPEHVTLKNYQFHPPIKAELAVVGGLVTKSWKKFVQEKKKAKK